MNFKITDKTFQLNGEDFFLHAAEMQYFRLEKSLWPLHLKKIKQAGINAVTTYIPWDFHEPEEGRFDLTDLVDWLDLCKEYGLYIIVKPGPYILAEYIGAGIPEWFISKYHKECEVKNSSGQKGQDDVMSFMHPKFLEYALKWFDNVMPVIAKRQISNNGNIIMLQICNEVGVFTWLKKQADYSKHCLEMYEKFSGNKTPPSDKTCTYNSLNEIAEDITWHNFWRHYYAEYLRLLMSEVRKRGVNIQFYHNLPGWIYGRGYDFPINITMYDELEKDYPDIVLGVDHIPENISYRNFHDDMIINEMVWAQQGGRGPLFGAEFQAGSREYCTVTFPGELDLFYKASLANGLVGWNYYAFSSGKNPEGKGFSGKSFYWYTPLDQEGKEGSLYPVIKKMGRFINTFGKDIVRVKKKSDICVLFYRQYYATEIAKNISKENCDIDFDYMKIRQPAYFDSLLKVLQILNIDFDMLDAELASKEELAEYKQVWMFSCDVMAENVQKKLAEFLCEGGNLAIYPTLPKYDTSMKNCTVLADTIEVSVKSVETYDMPKITAFGDLDISVLNPVSIYTNVGVPVMEPVNDANNNCGFIKKVGKGKVLVSGVYFNFAIEEHKDLYIKMIESLDYKIEKHADRKKDRLCVKQRFHADYSFLFVGNYYNETEKDTVYYTHPKTGKKYSIELTMPPISGFFTPINKKLDFGINLLHTTSDILDINIGKNEIKITFQGQVGLTGQMVFIDEEGNLDARDYDHTGQEQKLLIHT